MKIADFSVDRPVAISMVIVAIVLLGLFSLPNLAVSLIPDMDFPVAVVMTSYRGAAPAEVEKLVTKPIESAVSSVSDLDEVSSRSSSGQSIVIVQFNYGTDLDDKVNDLRDKVDQIRDSLPDDCGSPTYMKADVNSQPIMTYSLFGNNLSKLKEVAEDTIEPRLERVDGVASVSVSGGKEREIQVKLDQTKLNAYGLTVQQVSQAISGDDITGTAGTVVRGSSEIYVRVMNEFETLDAVKNVQVSVPGSLNHISLQEIADVSDSFAKDSSLTYVNGKPALSIDITKTSDGNTVQIAKKVKEAMAGITLPSGLKIDLISDTSTTISDTIRSVEEHGILGGVLAVVILFFFLASIRSTLVVGLSLPIALIGTFMAMYYGDQTINMLSLGGLMLGLGSLVDFAIVVLESIYRKRQEGLDVVSAAKVGTAEVGTAVMASAASQIVVFLPVVFVSGLASELFTPLALTVSFSHACALFSALTLVPMMASKLLKSVPPPEEEMVVEKGTKNPVTLFGYGIQWLTARYRDILHWSLGHRKTVVIFTIAMLVASLGGVTLIGKEFIPSMDERGVNVSIEMPSGTQLEVTKEKSAEVNALAQKALSGGIDSTLMTVGGGSSFFGGGTSTASINYKLKSVDEYQTTADEASELVRQAVADVAGATVTVEVESSAMSMSSSDVEVVIRGTDLDVLRQLGDQGKSLIQQVSGTRNVSNSLSDNNEVQVAVDREKASQYGLSAGQILSVIKTAMGGTKVSSLHTGDNTVDITLKYADDFKNKESNLSDLLLVSSSGAKVSLSDVADISVKEAPTQINRSNQNREVDITADVSGRDSGSVNQEVKQKLAQLKLPEGYYIDYGGSQENMTESFRMLGLALVLGIVLVFMVMAAQFESLFQPFIIMFCLPPTFVGAVIGLLVTGSTLSVMSLIGAIMLVGIVLNNAIVLVDYINTLRKRGVERNEAITTAGPIRLRPILMTTLCTVLALFPMALGSGSGNELMKPMAVVIAFGLTFSTLITLVLVPVVYTIFDDAGIRISRWMNGKLAKYKKASDTPEMASSDI